MQITMCNANCVENAANCSYPNKVTVTDAASMESVIAWDHVCAIYKGNRRSNDNFIESDVIPMDIDNDHSDNPDDWITEEKMEKLFGDIDYVLAPSRHHMLTKDGRSERPRYHVYFPIEKCTDVKKYTTMKTAIQKAHPFFDDNALDAARFLFGSKTDEVIWHEGWMSIIDDIETEDADDGMFDDGTVSGSITEGSRNKTLSRFAGKVLKRYGECDKAHEVFMKQADKCDPPLDVAELNTIWFSALKFFRNKISGSSGYVPPDQYNDDFCGEPGSLRPDDYSDVGQAKVLSATYGDELKYTPATDYIRFDGEVWVEDRQMAVGACVEFLDLQLQDAKDYMETAKKALVDAGYPEESVNCGSKVLAKDCDIKPDDLSIYYMLVGAEKYMAFAMKRRDYKYITSALNVAKSMLSIKVSDLDKNPNLLNTPYATYDLTKGIAGEQPHDPSDLITKITECSPGDEGMDIWLDALDTFFCSDTELIEYVQKVIGLAAIGRVYEEFIIIAYGDGANGKSTFWNTVARVLGTYSGKISSDILTMGNKVNAQPEMAELKGKRLIIASEMQEGVRLNTAVVKQLCSTDEIQACKKYKDPFHFVPSHQVVLYTNHLPKVGANDDGIWRRLKVIPFNAKIKGNSDIKNYADYLYEKAGSAIMKWIIEGAKKVSKSDHKVDDPKCVKDAVAAYRDDNDWLGHFIADCCEVDNSYEEKSGEFYQQYRAYCIQSGEYIRSTTDFYAAVEKMGFYRRKTNKGSFVTGVKLKTGSDFI